MSFPWKAVIQAAGSGATTMFLPQFAPLIVPALNAMLQQSDEDLMVEWGKDIEALAKNGRVSSDAHRAMMMKGKIRWDLYQKRGEPPPQEEVRWMLETLVMTYYGVEDVDALSKELNP